MVNSALIYEDSLRRGCYLTANKEHFIVFVFNKHEANYKPYQVKHGFPVAEC